MKNFCMHNTSASNCWLGKTLTIQEPPEADAVAEGTDQHCGLSWVYLL